MYIEVNEKEKKKLIELYLFFTTIYSLFAIASFFISHSLPLSSLFFPSILFILSAYSYYGVSNFDMWYRHSSYYYLLFPCQMLLTLASNTFLKTIGGFYLAFIPSLMGVYLMAVESNFYFVKRVKKNIFVLFLITALSFISFVSFDKEIFKASEVIVLFMYIAGVTLFISELGSVSVKKSKKSKHVNKKEADSFFFHDLINHTHGMSLFLNNRVANNRNLTLNECKDFLKEIKSLESLLKDHFKLDHKNLTTSYDYVPFDNVKSSFLHRINNYFKERDVSFSYSFKGDIGPDSSPFTRDNCLVHYPTFQRVMGNIVKNLFEANTDSASFIFEYRREGLYIEVVNTVTAPKDNELAKDLSQKILHEHDSHKESKGLGLDSIQHLCEQIGGEFSFQIREGKWISQIFLPSPMPNKYSQAS